MTGKDFLAQAAGTMAASHLREIAEWVDKCAALEAEVDDLRLRLAEREREKSATGSDGD